MATTYKGSCSCGQVKLEVEGDPFMVALCHCYNCQKSTGTTYSTNWIVPRPNFKVVAGEAKGWETTGGSSDSPTIRKFCGTCGSTMWIEASKLPDIVVVKAGIMDDGAMAKFTPSSETFTSRKPGWVPCVEGARQYEENFKQ